MKIYNVSISHKTAPVEVRELLAFTEEEKVDFICNAIRLESVSECVLITTCNRSEVYLSGEQNAVEDIMLLLVQKKKLEYEPMLKYFRIFQQEKAIEHLYKVASGMDSMLIGEDEILGQVKSAYELALNNKTTGYYLNTLFRDAITCAKRVKTDTNLSKTSISIATLAAHAVFDFQSQTGHKKVLIIGLTGKMGTIVMKNLYKHQEITLIGTTRKHKSKEDIQVIYPKVTMVDYANRYDYIDEADIIVSATTSPHYTITKDMLHKNITVQKERLFLDLAVPMDIDRTIRSMEGITLYDIDYFTELSKKNNEQKLMEVERAKQIIEEEVDEFLKWMSFKEFIPHLSDIKELVNKEGFEKVIYQVRSQSSSKELDIILDSFKRLLES
ncbi:glutamyl-tRNA reductase [Anaeromicropila herbilytica]|uniref:Glutamyl-tRNA reductase n=1 Tax=Anaeromicropila herbilytica TaxID=2785025 RepID=A0A7R7ENU7_9FIRM|nr:glutamyl-tRNA reductase [Anaeromicropila herbilytica]BCN32174.1 glutamyl-tRNA reductase [Anaeromicropila herbilytica]